MIRIAIQGHPTRGKEVIQILESLGGKNIDKLTRTYTTTFYYIDDKNEICDDFKKNFSPTYKLYTLEKFEKEFPFKVGDKVTIITNTPYKIVALEYYRGELSYKLDNGLHCNPKILTPYKEMKEERNITLTLDKAKEWYKKGGELKEIALQAFNEKELNSLPKSWEEFCKQGNPIASWRYNIPTKYEALFKLEHLKDCWCGNWKPEWNASRKYVIKNLQGKLTIIGCSDLPTFLVFPTREMAEEFLKCFRDLIEKAGDLI